MNTPKEIKVLIIPSWYPPDGGRFFQEQAEMLQSEEFRVSVMVNRIIGIRSHNFKEIVTAGTRKEGFENNIFVYRSSILKIPGNEEWNIRRWIKKSLRQFRFYIRKHGNPDILLVHSSLFAGSVAVKIKSIYKIPFILIEHRGRFINNSFSHTILKDWQRKFYISAFNDADRIVCVSDPLKKGIQEITGLNQEKFTVIPNPVDHDFYNQPLHPRELQPFIFISIGALKKVKGFDNLLKAFAEFTEKMEGEFFLRIGGKGSLEKELKLLAHDLGIFDRVSFTGKLSRDRVRDEMHRSNVFVSSSRMESFGIVLVEAAMTGMPLIATRSGGPQSIIDEENGIITETDDPYALEKVMEKMYFEYSKYKPELIRQNTIGKYNKNLITDKYFDLIRDVLNG